MYWCVHHTSPCLDSVIVCSMFGVFTTIAAARAALLREEAAGWLIISLREKLCFREVLTLKPACAQQIN